MAEPLPVSYVITMIDGYNTLIDTLWEDSIIPSYKITFGNDQVAIFHYDDEASTDYWTFTSEGSPSKITVDYDTYETKLVFLNGGPNSVPIKKVEIVYYNITEDFAEAVRTVIQSL